MKTSQLSEPAFGRAETLPFRAAPHNIEAEQALLGAILVNNEACDRVSSFLEPRHFFDPLHGRIYEAAAKLIMAGKRATPITLKTFFEREEPIASDLTVPQYLGRLAANATTVINAEHYGRTIYDLAVRRSLIVIGEDMVNAAYDAPIDLAPSDQIEDAEQQLYELAETGKYGSGFEPFAAALTDAIDMAANAYQRDGGLSGLATGFRDLDARMGGLQPSDLVILAGRPSMGKAQPLNAKIKTTHGWTTMGELKLGDELASIDGRRSIVRGIFPQGEKRIFRVTFSDGRTTECCAEHFWKVHYRSWPAAKVLSTSQIIELLKRKRYQRRLWIDHCSGHFGHQERLPIDPWLLGALLGDGSLKGGSLRFSCASVEILEKVREAVGAEIAVTHLGRYDYRLVQAAGHRRKGRQGVWPNPLKQALTSFSLWDVGSEEKFIPELYLQADRESRLALLRGLLDTDGWIERWGSVRFATSSERLADNVVELARSLGAWCTKRVRESKYSHKGERRSGRRSYVCNIHYSEPCALFSVPEKKARAAKPRRHRNPVFVSIEVSRVAEARCIAVTHPDQLYITDNYVVTHNTALATNIAYHVARAYKAERIPDGSDTVVDGAVVGFFSLEMSSEQLATRIISEQAGIPSERIRRGRIERHEFDRLVEVSQELQNLPLYIDQTGGISVAQLAARARRLKRQRGLGLVVVDYLQLLTGSSRRASEGRVQEVTEITTGLKALAKELNLPILALSQLSRQVEQRDDKRPQLSDLRESGSIEQDADVVMFVFREEYYVERRQPREGTPEHMTWQDEMASVEGLAEVIIGKQRHGPTGTVRMQFKADVTRFGDYIPPDHLPERRG